MNFLPSLSDSIDLSISRNQLVQNFARLIRTTNSLDGPKFLFSGWWDQEHFVISQILKIPNRFTPVIDGRITTANDKITLKLQFSLQKTTLRRLMIYSIVSLLLTAYFIIGFNAWWYGSISFSFGLVNYILTHENFKIQTRKSRRALNLLFLSD
jgi:hypothetical protein